MKKVLFVIPSMKKGGGAERVVLNLINGFNTNKHTALLLNFYDRKNSFAVHCKNYNLKEKDSKLFFLKILKLIKRAREIKKICEKEEIAVIISFLEDANFPCLISKILFGNKCKLIISTHNDPTTKPLIYKILIKTIYNKASKIISVSRGIEQSLIKTFNIRKNLITTIYNPLDLNSIFKKEKSLIPKELSLLLKSNNFKFISIGRLAEQKNHFSTIESFEKILKKYPNTELLIIGDGPQKRALQEIIQKRNLGKKIHLLGFHKNPFPFLKSSDCFILNSKYEGFGIVITEALACNLPVISSDCDFGPREILCENIKVFNSKLIKRCTNGLLVPVNDPNSLAEAMETIIKDNELRNEYKKTARARAFDFDIKNIIKKWEDLIENV